MIRALFATALLCLATAAHASPGKRIPGPPPVTGVVNINEASAKQLALLPGVGPSRAQAILAYRAKAHFAKIDDVRKVKGVGKGVFKKIAPLLVVSGQTTIAKVTKK